MYNRRNERRATRLENLIELNQIERQLILYDVFTTFEKITCGDIQFVLRKIEKRTLQRDVRDLMDAGLISVKYSKSEQAYIHMGKPSGEITVKENISKRKMLHLKRLQRLAGCMRLVDNPDPVASYFEMFPDSSERMRQRDFETLRHIGFEAGYDRAYREYIVNNNEVGAYDGYGIFIRDGKMVRYL